MRSIDFYELESHRNKPKYMFGAAVAAAKLRCPQWRHRHTAYGQPLRNDITHEVRRLKQTSSSRVHMWFGPPSPTLPGHILVIPGILAIPSRHPLSLPKHLG